MHLAAQSHVDFSFSDPLYTMRCNTESTLALLDELVEYHKLVPELRVLHMSTDEVYGDAVIEKRTSGCDENADFAPTNPYDAGGDRG